MGSLAAGGKIIRLGAGDSWTKGDTSAIKFDHVDHIDVVSAAEFTVDYENVYDSAGALATGVSESLDPIRYEAGVSTITVTSGVVRLIQM